MALIELAGVRKRYGDATGEGRLALDGVSLAVEKGELVAVVGTSGSGKSTLLQIAGGLDAGYDGSARLEGEELRALSDTARARLRHRAVGFVFQSFHLVPEWSVRDNVALPASFAPAPVRDLDQRVRDALARVGLEARAGDKPTALSGGQRQRVAIARAIVLEPPLLLCDEPTGSLDTETGALIIELLAALHRERGLTLVLVTHEERVAAIARRTVRLEHGKVASDTGAPGGGAS